VSEVMGLFGPQPAPPAIPSHGRKPAQPKGYGGIPGTGPEGMRCKHCRHCVANRLAKTYWKCALNRARWTGGRGSDIKVNTPACSRFEPAEQNRTR
jgi:hypothetical protein